MLSRSTVLVTALALVALAAGAQVKQAESKLTGRRNHTWIYARLDPTPEGGCRAGETWKFSSNHEVLIKKCVDGKVVETQANWSVAEEKTFHVILAVGEDRYFLRFFQTNSDKLMQLRTVDMAHAKERIDKTFKQEDD